MHGDTSSDRSMLQTNWQAAEKEIHGIYDMTPLYYSKGEEGCLQVLKKVIMTRHPTIEKEIKVPNEKTCA